MEYDGADVDGVVQEVYDEDGGFENDIELGDDFQMRDRGRSGFRYPSLNIPTSSN